MQSRMGRSRSTSEAFSGDNTSSPLSPPDNHSVTWEERAAGLSPFF